jgi:Asp-tRNA(Asn)/Glu-tRNA(Gln) amidotransferase A subunit family amidase
VGPIARTAPDAALLLAGMCGTDPRLPLARPERPGDFLGLRPASRRRSWNWPPPPDASRLMRPA